MLYTVFLTLMFAMVLLCLSYKNRYIWIFVFIFLSLATTCLSMILYINKLSHYMAVFPFEYKIFIWLYELKIGFYTISKLLNISTAVFMFSMGSFCLAISKNKITVRKRVLYTATYVIPVFLFIWANDPETSYYLYIKSNTLENEYGRYLMQFFSRAVIWFNFILLYMYMILPIAILLRRYFKSSIFIKKSRISKLVITLVLIDLYYIIFFILSPFKYISERMVDKLKFSTVYDNYIDYYSVFMPLITLIMIVIILVLIVRFNLLDTDKITKNEIKKRLLSINKDIYNVFHSHKNALFAIAITARNNIGKCSVTDEAFYQIEGIADDSMRNLSKLLNILNNIELDYETISITECINAAIKKVPKNNNISIAVNICGDDTNCKIPIDASYMTEVFVNMISNSIEAIEAKDIKNGKIEFNIFVQDGWMSISITDNGCGIHKKDYKKIFNPLNTTKKTHTNWGIGLSFVYNVVNAHMGFISVSSAVGEYTKFEILLPLKTTNKYI